MLSLEQMAVTAYMTDGGIICTGCLNARAANGDVVWHDGDAFYAADTDRRDPILALIRYTVDGLADGDGDCSLVVCDDCHDILAESHTDGETWDADPFAGCYCD